MLNHYLILSMIAFYLFIGNFILILMFIGFSVLVVLNPSLMKGISLEDYSNDYCQSKKAVTNPNDPLSLVCNNKYKKDKFIWIFIDGLAHDQLAKIPHRKEFNFTNFFLIESNEYKQSGSLLETIITGKFSRNYPAQETSIDHIFKQANNCDHSMAFVGSKFPLYHLLGQEESKIINDSVIRWSESHAIETLCPGAMINIWDGYASSRAPDFTINDRHLKPNISLTDVYEALLENYGQTQKEIKNKFTYCLHNDHFKSKPMTSLIFYTSRIDHYNHSFDKRNYKTIINVFSVEMGLLGVAEWIDSNPEYALIISSDHGGQRYNGQDDICNHGCNEEGNEAILLVYTKELGMSYDVHQVSTKKINHNNVAPTVAQIIKGVNIPLEAQGIAYELSNDNILRYTAVKSKEIQLIQYIEKYLLKFPNKQKVMEQYIKTLTQSEFATKITTMDQVSKMSDNFYSNYQKFLLKTQQEIFNAITRETSSILGSFIFYSVICLLVIKISFELRYIKSKVSFNGQLTIIHYILLALICFSLVFEVIFSFIFYNVNIEKIIIIARCVEGFILFITSLVYFKLFSYDNSKQQLKIALCIIGIAIISILSVKFDTFPIVRYYFTPTDKRFMINIALIYPLTLIFLLYETHSLSYLYLCSKPKLRLCYFLYPLNILIIGIMFWFDKDLNESFISHTPYRKYLARVVYGIICFYFLLSYIPLYESRTGKTRREEEKELNTIIEHKKIKAHLLIKIPMFLYVFFISDETERLLMFFVYYPLNYFVTKHFKETNIYWKMICLCFLLMIPDILYI